MGTSARTTRQCCLLMVFPDSSTRILSKGFFSASDPDVSFDGTRILFAGKRKSADDWNIYEATLDGQTVRQITEDLGDCRRPCYQGTLFTLDSPAPWHEITFVSHGRRVWNECGSLPLTNLYSCKPDGSTVRRLTFNMSNDTDPCLLDDGRLVFSSWQRATLERGRLGYAGLFAINVDGTDFSLFAEDRGKACKRMPCVTANGMVVFVETDMETADEGGTLALVTVRRPLHSYRPITKHDDGRFRSPSPLPDGKILVCRQAVGSRNLCEVDCLDVDSGHIEPIFRDPRFHCIGAKLIRPRVEPDGRSSNVQENDARGKLYCLDVCTSGLKNPVRIARGTAKRIRVLEGVPQKIEGGHSPPVSGKRGTVAQGPTKTAAAMAPRRILGEVAMEEDGSFNISVPANKPIRLQLVDGRGMALRSCGWIWARNHESRGCIGCHEDGELAPEDRFAKALASASVVLPSTAPRRTPDFQHDVFPIVRNQCLDCHRKEQSPPYFAEPPGPAADQQAARRVYEQLLVGGEASDLPSGCGKYVHPGKRGPVP